MSLDQRYPDEFIEFTHDLIERIQEASTDQEKDGLRSQFFEAFCFLDRINIAEGELRSQADPIRYGRILRFLDEALDASFFEEFFTPENRKEIWQELDLVEEDWKNHSKRYYSLRPPIVYKGTKIPEALVRLHAESRWCFVYGQYNAVITLSRAIIDATIKDEIPTTRTKHYLNLLEKNKRKLNAKQLPKMLERVKKGSPSTNDCLEIMFCQGLVSKEIKKEVKKKIIEPANLILHENVNYGYKECLEALEQTKKFLEQVYGKRPYRQN